MNRKTQGSFRAVFALGLGCLAAASVFAGGKKDSAPAGGSKLAFEAAFEDGGSGGFTGRGGKELLTAEADAHSGKYALKTAGRSASWNGPSLDMTPFITEGNEYTFSLWIKLLSPPSAQVTLSTQVGSGSAAAYSNIQGKTLKTSDGYVHYEGTYRYTSTGGFVSLYVESADGTASFLIDDLQIMEVATVPVTVEKLKPLKDVYAKQFLVGNVVSAPSLEGVKWQLLTRHFNVFTAENAMKPGSLQAVKGVFTFADADAMVDSILAAGFKMHGHTLAWHQQSPDWMNRAGISRNEAVDNLETHVKTVASHYQGRVISWDVLNEAIIDNPPNPSDWKASLRRSPWYNAIGEDYVEIAFKAAREADPKAKLYYNDYNLDNQEKALAVYTMVKELNEKNPDVGGRPLIDGVGMQGHYRVNTSPANVEKSLERFVSLGVEVSITELDVQAGADGKLTAEQAIAQGRTYAALFTLFKKYAKNIGRVTIWGLDDGASWRSSTNPTLFDSNLRAKPAFQGALNPAKFLREHKAPPPKSAKTAEARYGTPVIDGDPDPLWEGAPALEVSQQLTAWQGASGTARALWDEKALYVLVTVQGAELNKASPNAYEQDSVEVFVDEDNGKTPYLEDGDGQYRVNFANEATFNPASAAAGFTSAAKVSGKSYTVEFAIPFKTIAAKSGMRIGFDVQINGASASGARQSVTVWSDITGNGFQDTSGYGVLVLQK